MRCGWVSGSFVAIAYPRVRTRLRDAIDGVAVLVSFFACSQDGPSGRSRTDHEVDMPEKAGPICL